MVDRAVPYDILRAKPQLRRPDRTPERPRFPVIDAHNHLFIDDGPEALLRTMDAVGVRTFVNLTGNAALRFENGEYRIERRDLGDFLDRYVAPHPGRFAAFTQSEFAQYDDPVLPLDGDFTERTVATLRDDVRRGAVGLKILKELGLRFVDSGGVPVAVDDARLAPVWTEAGRLGVPVLIHTSDPVAFFLPVDHENEHYVELVESPSWRFHGAAFSKDELIAQRNRLIARHPETTFLLPHVGNYPEDLDSVARVLDAFPNTFVDISARIDELGRQPYSARDFLVRYSDRVLFGTDMPVTPAVYRAHYRFLETRDEYFDHPDYLGRFGHIRWRIYGLHLPDAVLEKVYASNARRAIPGLGG